MNPFSPFEDTVFYGAHVRDPDGRWTYGIKGASRSACDYTDVEMRAIDAGPTADLAHDDAIWGDQDNLANVPRATMPGWVKALRMEAGE